MKSIASLASIISLFTSAAFAQSELPTFADIATNDGMKAAFATMVGEQILPEWVAPEATQSASVTVSFGGRQFVAMTACKPDDCGANMIAVLYDAANEIMYGVLSTRPDEESGTIRKENLQWLNIGGGDESIDGRTILYAAITGSLQNGPENFDVQPTE